MALALAGAIDALLLLIEARDVPGKLRQMRLDLEAQRPFRVGAISRANVPFQTITNAYADQLGGLGDDQTKATLIREIEPLWEATRALGINLVRDLRASAGRSGSKPPRP